MDLFIIYQTLNCIMLGDNIFLILLIRDKLLFIYFAYVLIVIAGLINFILYSKFWTVLKTDF